MAQSFGNIQSHDSAGHAMGMRVHNLRLGQKDPSYLLPEQHRLGNWSHEYDLSINDVIGEIELNKSNGLKLHHKAKPFKEILFAFEEHHTQEDIKRTVDKVCSFLNVRPMYFAAHRDEGHINDGEVDYNFHCHVGITTNIPETNKQIRITRQQTSDLQTLLSDELSMERAPGKWSDEGSKRMHINHHEYRQLAEQSRQKINQAMRNVQGDTVNELEEVKTEIKEVAGVEDFQLARARMKASGLAKKEDYQELARWRKLAKSPEEVRAYVDKIENLCRKLDADNKQLKEQVERSSKDREQMLMLERENLRLKQDRDRAEKEKLSEEIEQPMDTMAELTRAVDDLVGRSQEPARPKPRTRRRR